MISPRLVKKTSSFGVAMRHAQESAMSVLKRADEALYSAKNQGRNRVESFCWPTAKPPN
ncbi:diguanylate cyclase domain-containing protein [Magnetococcus marinus]|uniref:diguanylate cyclase domain-containing protein n=1 Tax=Magnetococcus marinus TaxID=1124597 RepID=UPI0003251FAC|nr:diguanylate cyclase [Magnetococcus marinus]